MKRTILPALFMLTACGGEVVSTPPPERFAPVAYPAVPEGEAEGGALSDRQTGQVINSLIDAIDVANGRLEWLADYFGVE